MKYALETPDAPEAVASYSQGIVLDNVVMTSGQVALVPGEELLLDNESPTTETHRIMSNLSAILNAAGCTFSDVYSSRIYISDMRIFREVNQAYAQYFAETPPVRECVVAQPPLPGANVEISMQARMNRRTYLKARARYMLGRVGILQ